MRRRIFSFLLSLTFVSAQYAFAADGDQELRFKFYTPLPQTKPAASPADSAGGAASAAPEAGGQENGEFSANDFAEPGQATSTSTVAPPLSQQETKPADADQTVKEAGAADAAQTEPEKVSDKAVDSAQEASGGVPDKTQVAAKVLQGYIRVVPSGTKIPIIIDTPVDSDTSQEGDEFTARTAEDLMIDGNTALPAGSVIKGRIARIEPPKHMGRSGSVALKFDTVTTPDNRQIPIVANLVAHGGVVHARRGLKDVAIDTTTFALPTAAGLGIGLLAGGSSTTTTTTTAGTTSSDGISQGAAMAIGVAVGAAVGVAILAIKKGKKVDVRPGDELKIELAEDLRMPM
jgi:hypothetical protein